MVKRQRSVVGHVADDAAGCAAIAKLECPSSDRRTARIAVVGGQDGRACADLIDRTCPRDQAREGHRIAAVEGERAVVDGVADDAPGRAAIAKLECPGSDRRTAAGAARARRY